MLKILTNADNTNIANSFKTIGTGASKKSSKSVSIQLASNAYNENSLSPNISNSSERGSSLIWTDTSTKKKSTRSVSIQSASFDESKNMSSQNLEPPLIGANDSKKKKSTRSVSIQPASFAFDESKNMSSTNLEPSSTSIGSDVSSKKKLARSVSIQPESIDKSTDMSSPNLDPSSTSIDSNVSSKKKSTRSVSIQAASVDESKNISSQNLERPKTKSSSIGANDSKKIKPAISVSIQPASIDKSKDMSSPNLESSSTSIVLDVSSKKELVRLASIKPASIDVSTDLSSQNLSNSTENNEFLARTDVSTFKVTQNLSKDNNEAVSANPNIHSQEVAQEDLNFTAPQRKKSWVQGIFSKKQEKKLSITKAVSINSAKIDDNKTTSSQNLSAPNERSGFFIDTSTNQITAYNQHMPEAVQDDIKFIPSQRKKSWIEGIFATKLERKISLNRSDSNHTQPISIDSNITSQRQKKRYVTCVNFPLLY